MPKIIRAADRSPAATFNFDDVAAQAEDYVAKARAEAARIVAEASQAATAIRERAENEGVRSAEQSIARQVDQRVAEQLAKLKPDVQRCLDELQRVRQDWLVQWEKRAVRLATAIARRVIRDELHANPDIPVNLVREALQLAAGSARVRILVNPADAGVVGSEMQRLLDELAPVASTELVADSSISLGGCRIETEHGSIDQQFAAQLARIEEELT